ncbi:hypothetical protein ACOSP7_018715 [Xanthoceras sorbifolium]
MMQAGYDIDNLFKEAQSRWLKPAEVLFILQNHEKYQITQEAPQKPTGGSVFLFNKRVLRFFRKDGHNWRKKKDGRAVGEAHERLKVGNVEALNCYYAHGEQNPNFQRRSYWMLDPAYEHIVLVHYREITEGKATSGSVAVSPGASSTLSVSSSSHTTQNPGSTSVHSDFYEPSQSLSSPGSVEVSSEITIKDNGVDSNGEFTRCADAEVSQALRRLEEQLSLNDDIYQKIDSLSNQDFEYEGEIFKQQQYEALLQSPEYNVQEHPGFQDHSNNLVLHHDTGVDGQHLQHLYGHGYADGSKEPLSWQEVLETCKSSSIAESQQLSSSGRELAEKQEQSHWTNFNGSHIEHSNKLLPQEVNSSKRPAYSSVIGTYETNSDYNTMFFDQDEIGVPLEGDLSLTVAQKQKFTIREISPEWGYTTEATKVIIVGSFLCDPSESAWSCMFGDTEVPIQIIQDGVIRCEAPPRPLGKVTLCITSGNRESCSEVKEFDYRVPTSSCIHDNLSQTEATKGRDELLLLVRFVQMLLSDSSVQKGDGIQSGHHLLRRMKADDDLWGQVIEALLVGSGTSSSTIEWLMQELLKDKLQQWLSSKSMGESDQPGCSLSKKEQGIIHMIAGLGFEWALNPILCHGVNVNFRDINGWTALHWASRFGREKMVAALIASGASAGAVTDPTSQDPTGRTPASIAASSGHKGLAGYLSEVALTSHLSSLTLEESELSKGSAEVEAEIAVNSVSNGSLSANEDQLSLKDTLAAVRNAAQAAARIQSAFRAHSFRKRQERDSEGVDANIDQYGIYSDDIPGILAMSKLTFRNVRDYNSAALSIQKKYRGWKGRKDYLALRQKVVKIQAHVRGYQVRKNYKVICWAVGVLDKVILRWRRKGVGLRGYRQETESIDDSEDEDILKVFRKQKVDGAIDEAVSRVLGMVDSPDARQQYRRMLERYRQAKAEFGETSEAAAAARASLTAGDIVDMDNDDSYLFA